MIHYNPEKHHDILMEYLAVAMNGPYELDQPYVPPQNDGTTNHALCTGEQTYLFTSPEEHRQLILDATEYIPTVRKRIEEKLPSIPAELIISISFEDWIKYFSDNK